MPLKSLGSTGPPVKPSSVTSAQRTTGVKMRLHPGPVDARQQEDLVVDLGQRGQVLRVEDVAARVLHDHAHRVAQAAQLAAVLEVVLDVRVRHAAASCRSSRVTVRPRSWNAKKTVSRHAAEDHPGPVVEDRAVRGCCPTACRSCRGRRRPPSIPLLLDCDHAVGPCAALLVPSKARVELAAALTAAPRPARPRSRPGPRGRRERR